MEVKKLLVKQVDVPKYLVSIKDDEIIFTDDILQAQEYFSQVEAIKALVFLKKRNISVLIYHSN